MSAIQPIVINDGAATPVAHTFTPVTSVPPFYRESQSALALVGQGTIELTSKAESGNGMTKVRLVLALPALEAITGSNGAGYTAQPKVAYTNKVDATFFLPNRGSMQQRKDLRVLLMNALANAQVIDAIDNVSQPY